MFTSPQCRCELVRKPGTKGVFWGCPQCHGRAVGLALLRRTIGDKVVFDAWRSSLVEPAHLGRPCPVCARRMREVTVVVEDQSLTLDVCRRCEFMWFDTAEYEAIPVAPPKSRALGDVDETAFPYGLPRKLGARLRKSQAPGTSPRSRIWAAWASSPGLSGVNSTRRPPLESSPLRFREARRAAKILAGGETTGRHQQSSPGGATDTRAFRRSSGTRLLGR